MQIIPAIDFRDGKVVNLKQGRLDRLTTYSDDPVGMADHWVAQGCERMHLVDLDGAFAGRPVNADVIRSITRNHPDLTIQLGGGVRTVEAIEAYLEAGVQYLIIGTRAVQEPEFVGDMCRRFPGHIIVGLDGRNGMLAINGWKQVTDIPVKSLAMRFEGDGFEGDGIAAIVYTDISRDGMMGGINLDATRELANSVSVPVIASGGVTDIRDIEALLEIEGLEVAEPGTGGPDTGKKAAPGITGVITGRAIYEGTLDLAEAIALCRGPAAT